MKDIQKQLSKPKHNWADQIYYQKIFKFKPKRIEKDGYIKRSAIDDKKIAQFFNKTFPDQISSIFKEHDENTSKHNLDAYSGMIIGKYFNNSKDFKNLEQVNSKFKDTPEKYHYNPVALTKSNRKLFPRLDIQPRSE